MYDVRWKRAEGRGLMYDVIYGSGFMVKGSGFMVKGSGFMVKGSGFMVKDFKIYNQKTYFIS